MPIQASEAIVLRTYPLKEADLIVSLFTRDQGKLRGVANRARRPKSGFGSTLERLTRIQIHYTMRENRELIRIEHCDLLESQFDLSSNFASGLALDVISEISEALLPPHEANEKFFRLLTSVLDFLKQNGEQGVWQAITYFEVWSVRLSGFLPHLRISEDSQAILNEILKTPISQLTPRPWERSTAMDLRGALTRLIEMHSERRLTTSSMLESLL